MSEPMSERWLPVVGFEGFYEVSDRGRVRSLPRVTIDGRRLGERILRPMTDEDGYHRVNLKMDGAIKRRGVHQLVTEAFVGPRPDERMVRHLDGNPANNLLGNLAYGTASENMQDEIRHGRNHHLNKTHCVHGHKYTPENTYRDGKGRRCRKCAAIRAQNLRDARSRSNSPR